MRALLISMMVVLGTSVASAYPDGTFNCKNGAPELPDNVYKIKTVSVEGLSVPHIEVTRHYRGAAGAPHTTTRVSGFGVVASTRGGQETLMLGALRFEFEGDTILNCRQ